MRQVTITRKKLRNTISIAPSLRRQHLHELVIALELDRQYPKGKAIRQLRAIEQMKKTHASIGFYMKPNQKSDLKHIEVPRDFKNWNNISKSKKIRWDTVTDPEQIEEILIDRNRQHLGQAQGTLFTTPEVLKLIGYNGYSEGSDSVLKGTVDTSHIRITPLQKTYFPTSNVRRTKIKAILKIQFQLKI